MIEQFKDMLGEVCERWASEAKSSDNGKRVIVVDIASEIKQLFGRLMVQICFGEDISMQEVKIWMKYPEKKGYTEESVPLWKCVETVLEQLTQTLGSKRLNPLYDIVLKLTGYSMSMTKFERKTDQNCARLRNVIKKHVLAGKDKRAKASGD